MDKKLKQIQTELYEEASKYEFTSFITLTYPTDIYPITDESRIKTHFKTFMDKIRKNDKEQKLKYLYVYELHENGNLHIHLIMNIDYSKTFFKIKKYWSTIIGTSSMNSVKYEELISLSGSLSYFLKDLSKPTSVSNIQKKLGKDTHIISGSLIFKPILNKLVGHKIDIPIDFDNISKKSLKQIRTELLQIYTNSDILDQEISHELCAYHESLLELNYIELDEFLLTGRTKEKHIYKKYTTFLNKIAKLLSIEFKFSLTTSIAKVKYETTFIKIISSSLGLDLKLDITYYSDILFKSLNILIMDSIQKRSYTTTMLKIGNYCLKNIEVDLKTKCRLGHIIISLLVDLLKRHNILYFEKILKSEKNFELNLDTLILEEDFYIEDICYNITMPEIIEKKYNISQHEINNNLVINYPMIIEPKDWLLPKTNIIIDNIAFYDTEQVKGGGLCLNGSLLNKCLLKHLKVGDNHKLKINKKIIETINKIQKISYIVNNPYLSLLKKYINLIPDFLDKGTIKKLLLEKKNLNRELSNAFTEHATLIKNGANLFSNNKIIHEIRDKLSEIDSKFTKHSHLNRVLENMSKLVEYPQIYYSYDLDFRMRIYPQQNELSPQGSKLSRSLIHFKKKFKFNLEEFILYSTRLFKSMNEFKETELPIIFGAEILPILTDFCDVTKEKEIIEEIFKKEIPEPYLFLAACVEYKNYIEATKNGQDYYTGFPIILDCSGSGPQLISLTLSEKSFASYLNLEPNDKRNDFYTSIIKDFIIKTPNLNKHFINYEDMRCLALLRKYCKITTMTQFYGISYLKFSSTLKKAFLGKNTEFKSFLNPTVNYDEFIDLYIKEYWLHMQNLPLFKLKNFFQIIGKLLKKGGNLSWKMLDTSHVEIDYKKLKKQRIDFKGNEVKRHQFQYLESTDNINYQKQIRSAQANFIHNLDAFVNMYILENYSDVLYSNHDAWAVGMGQSYIIRKILIEAYTIVGTEVYPKIIAEFATLLNNISGPTAKESFLKHCEKNMKRGEYNINSLQKLKYVAYFG